MEEKRIGSSTVGGTGFIGMLQIAFIVLKLCKVIKWRWIWVLAPTWISIILWLLILGIIGIVYYINEK